MKPSTTSRVVGNATWLVAAEAIGRVASFLVILHLTRHLTHGAIGTVELGTSMFGMLQLIVLGGIDVLATRRASRSAHVIQTLAGTFMVVAGLTFAIGFLVVLLYAALLAPEERTVVLAFAASVGLVPFSMRFAFQGRERMSVLAVSTIVSQLAWLGGIVLLVRGSSDLSLVAAIWVASQLIRTAIQLGAFFVWFGRVRVRLRWRRLSAWIQAAVPVSIGRVCAGAIFMVDILLLSSLSDLGAVGLYAVALKIPLFMAGVGNMVHSALFPPISRVVPSRGPEAGGELLLDVTKLALSLSIPASLALALVSEPLLVAIFGEQWSGSSDLFRILVWRAPLSALAGLYRIVVWSTVPRRDAIASATGLAIAVAAILILTPLFGAIGCAVAIVIGEATLFALYFFTAKPHLAFSARGHGSWAVRFAIGIAIVLAFGWYGSIAGAIVAALLAGLLPNFERIRRLRRPLA